MMQLPAAAAEIPSASIRASIIAASRGGLHEDGIVREEQLFARVSFTRPLQRIFCHGSSGATPCNLFGYRVIEVKGNDGFDVVLHTQIENERRVRDQEDDFPLRGFSGITGDLSNLLHEERLILGMEVEFRLVDDQAKEPEPCGCHTFPGRYLQRALVEVDDSTLPPAPPPSWRSLRTSTARVSPTGPPAGGAGRAGCTAPPDSRREAPAPSAGGRRPGGRREVRAVVTLRRRHPILGARPLRVLLARFLVDRVFSRARREPRQALPRSGRGRQAVPPVVDPGRRRLGVHGPVRAALRRTRAAPARPAARALPVERPRRTLQRHAAPGVPGPSRRRTHRRRRRRPAGQAPALAQPGKAPFRSCRS